jgi:hypothetical protein
MPVNTDYDALQVWRDILAGCVAIAVYVANGAHFATEKPVVLALSSGVP